MFSCPKRATQTTYISHRVATSVSTEPVDVKGKVTLFCLIKEDDPEAVFPIDIDKDQSVGHLKENIKQLNTPYFDCIPAQYLQLWKVNIPFTDAQKIKAMDISEKNLLIEIDTIEELWKNEPPRRHIHVVITHPPETLNKRQRIDKLQDVTEKDVGKFWAALKNVELEDSFLRLPQDTYFLGRKTRGSTMFVRNCYKDLADIVTAEVEGQPWRITGNPGIGKTFFGFYLLYLFARTGKTVIYHESGNPPIIFTKSGTSKMVTDNIHVLEYSYMNNPDVMYVVDGRQPSEFVAKTILICSPYKDLYREFDKYAGAQICYMPVWSEKEIKACRNEIFENVEKTKVIELYRQIGGIPRFVLEKVEHSKHIFEQALSTVKKDIIEYIGEANNANDVSHKLIHICTNPPSYNQMRVQFASDYVCERIFTKLDAKHRGDLQSFVCHTSSEGLYGPLRGHLFEMIAHQMLAQGGSFNIRCLSRNNASQSVLHMNQMASMKFDVVSDIENGKYCRPNRKNFTSVDAIVAPDKLFQITTSRHHPIKMNGLKDLKQKLALGNDICFYFVVPKELYTVYKEQPLHTANNTVALSVPKWITDNVKQYVLEIELSSGN